MSLDGHGEGERGINMTDVSKHYITEDTLKHCITDDTLKHCITDDMFSNSTKCYQVNDQRGFQ